MANYDDLDYSIQMVNRAQASKKQQQIIKTQDERLQAQYQEVKRQKLQRQRKKRKNTIKALVASALILGAVGGYAARPYVDAAVTISKNDNVISSAIQADYNNGMYVAKLNVYQDGGEIQYLPMEDKGFFSDVPEERTPDVSDAVTRNYVIDCIEIIDETCRDYTNGEKGYIEMLQENAELRKEVFGRNVESIGSILGVPLEDIYSPEELQRLAQPGVDLGGK